MSRGVKSMLYTLMYMCVLLVMLFHISACTHCITNYKDVNDSKLFGDSVLRIKAFIPYYLDDEMEIELEIKKKNLLKDKPIITAFFPSGDTLYPIVNTHSNSVSYRCTDFRSVVRSNDQLIVNVKYSYYLNSKIISTDSTFRLYKDEDCRFSARMH